MASLTVPLKLALDWKYSRVLASAASSSAEASDTGPTAVQLVPLLSEKNKVPFVLLVPVSAMPVTALSTSLTLSSPPAGGLRSTRLDTSVPTAPTGAPASSACDASTGDLLASSTGASFTGETLTVAVALLLASWPSVAV